MPNEQEKTLEALKYAIQMEIDGKVFYLKASQESGNDLGRKLLESLAQAEDYHRTKFEQIFDNLSKKQGWQSGDFKIDGGRTMRTPASLPLEPSVGFDFQSVSQVQSPSRSRRLLR